MGMEGFGIHASLYILLRIPCLLLHDLLVLALLLDAEANGDSRDDAEEEDDLGNKGPALGLATAAAADNQGCILRVLSASKLGFSAKVWMAQSH